MLSVSLLQHNRISQRERTPADAYASRRRGSLNHVTEILALTDHDFQELFLERGRAHGRIEEEEAAAQRSFLHVRCTLSDCDSDASISTGRLIDRDRSLPLLAGSPSREQRGRHSGPFCFGPGD